MKILIEKQSDKVVFAEDDLQFTSDGVKGGGWECHLFNDSNSEIIDVLAIPDFFVGNAFVFKDNAFVVVDNDLLQSEITRIDELKNSNSVKLLAKQDVENSLNEFAKQRDFDSIGEASALMNSTNSEWASEAQTFVRLWDETWQAFYKNQPLPKLSWL